MPAPSISEVLQTRDNAGEVLRRLVAPLSVNPSSGGASLPVDVGYSRMSLTYAPPITFVKEGSWSVGSWVADGPGGTGYWQVKLNPGAQIFGTEFEVHQAFPDQPYGVIMEAEIPEGEEPTPTLNPDSTYTSVYKSHITDP